jgi:hypothetical protein
MNPAFGSLNLWTTNKVGTMLLTFVGHIESDCAYASP